MRVLKNTTIFVNGSLSYNFYLNNSNYKIATHPLNNSTNSRYFSIDFNSYLHCYSGYTMS